MTDTSYPTAALRQAAQLLSQAQSIFVFSGAGLSKASGIPTYRDADGLWETGDNIKYAHINAYYEAPASFEKFWAARRRQLAPARPNPAHLALKELQKHKPSTTLATQNVDGLLQAAGCNGVLELHGNLQRSRCGHCKAVEGHSIFGRCLRCFSRIRPDVVLFGEPLNEDVLNAALLGASESDVVLVVGTSTAVEPAAQLPALAQRFGAKLILMDTNPPETPRAPDVILKGKAELLLPELVARMMALDTP